MKKLKNNLAQSLALESQIDRYSEVLPNPFFIKKNLLEMNETNGTYYLYLIEGGWVIYHTYTSDQFRINVNNNINKSRPQCHAAFGVYRH